MNFRLYFYSFDLYVNFQSGALLRFLFLLLLFHFLAVLQF